MRHSKLLNCIRDGTSSAVLAANLPEAYAGERERLSDIPS